MILSEDKSCRRLWYVSHRDFGPGVANPLRATPIQFLCSLGLWNKLKNGLPYPEKTESLAQIETKGPSLNLQKYVYI